MHSRTHLDYVLFQLTPTRTRCDLVMCAGNTTEKLASGLLEPFVSHLKSAKDQISKGGYSITLRSDGSWFTKATLERFVRFVSTPEVLERFVTLETEIQQIEKSIQSNEVENNDVNSAPEENSKVRLHRILETRRAVLRKEQAMAYARALVAGFDLEYLDDLISFANAFGALRLREACIKFMELCKEKEEDRLWVDEIAAMEAYSRPDLPYLATSGVVLANDAQDHNHIDMSVTDLSTSHQSLDAQATVGSDAKIQVPYPWQNHLQQQYMFPQMAPYPPPGYVFPGMQVPPSYYPNWPQAEDHGHAFSRDSDARSHKSKKKHRKASDQKVEEDESSTTVSDSETDGEVEKMHRKKHGKKSSRKVVIRNINYITSNRDGERKTGSSEGSSSDQDDNRAVGSFHKGKGSGLSHLKKQESENRHLKDEQDGWGAFESLLMREEEEPTSSVGVELHQEDRLSSKSSEVGPTRQRLVVSDDSLVMIEKDMSSNASARFEKSENGLTVHPTQKKVMGPSLDDSLFLQKSGTDTTPALDNDISIVSSSTRKVQRDGDRFIADPLNKPRENLELKVVEHDSAFFGGTERKTRDRVIDDSFMVEGRVTAEDHEFEARSMADISMVPDIIEPTKKEISSFEPDELYMMLDRDNEVDHAASAWTQEMIFESNNNLLSEVNRRQSESAAVVAADDSKLPSKNAKVKVPGKEARSRIGSVGRNKPDLTSRPKIPTAGSRVPVQRSKNVKEEENRRRMEELRIQRQKRIAERSANNGGKPGGTRRSTVETKVAKIPTEPKKTANQLKITETPKLPKPRSSIDRLAAARVTTKKVPQANSKMNGGSTQAADSKKPSSKKTEASKKKNGVQSSEAKTESRKLGGQEKESAAVLMASAESTEEQSNENSQPSDDFKDIKVLESIAVEQDKKPPAPVVVKPSKSVQFKPEAEISFISSPGYDTDNVRGLTLYPEPSPPNLPLQSSAVRRIEVNQNNSTTPPEEQVNSRKKWNGDEKLTKTTKGFRKLLLFGKKSLNSLRN